MRIAKVSVFATVALSVAACGGSTGSGDGDSGNPPYFGNGNGSGFGSPGSASGTVACGQQTCNAPQVCCQSGFGQTCTDPSACQGVAASCSSAASCGAG